MKVLQICPLWFPITIDAPGGIETFLARLVASLETLGCESTLLAADGVNGGAPVLPVMATGLRDAMAAGTAMEQIYYEQHQLGLALEHAAQFDLIHSHIGPVAYVLSGIPGLGSRVLHTQHTPVYPDMSWYVRQHPEMWFSTVSGYQARKLGSHPRCEIIPNGIDVASFAFSDAPEGGRLLFIGRLEHTKGPDVAVGVARSLGLPLTLAGPIVERGFFEETIRPYLDEQIRYVGVVNHPQKVELFGRSACVLLPFRGEEPFGLVTVEAMACGTPVVALANGALPEIIEPGLSGYLAQHPDELPALVKKAAGLDRKAIREQVEERFDMATVAKNYLGLYERMLRERS